MAKLKVKTGSGLSLQLDETNEIHRGGEGRILAIPSLPDKVAKIYHDNIQPITINQFNYLQQLDKNLFVIPVDVLYNKDDKIVGFTMEFISKDFFPIASVFNKSYCAANNVTPQLKRKVALSLIKALNFAHRNSIVVGDLNQYNILVNKDAEIRFIDVDSYQTPSHVHTGWLLDDIRDYLHGGNVSEKSDFFALSVLLFYTFTYTHPFKGIHKKYRKLSERMIMKLPVFVQDPDLIIPKCYEPVTDYVLHQQFERLYIAGERFLLDLDAVTTMAQPIKVKKIDIVIFKDVLVLEILEHADIRNIHFFDERGYIETDEKFFVYDCKSKGHVHLQFTISKIDWERVYISSQKILVQKDGFLFHYKNQIDIVKITNFKIPDDPVISQSGDILIIIGQDVMYWVYLNDILHQSIRNTRTEVFSLGFRCYSGLVQYTGGIFRIFYNTGKDLATVKLPVNAKDIYQEGIAGIVQFIDGTEVKNKYFKINGLSVEIAPFELSMMYSFGFMQTDKNEGFIFQPADNKIKIYRTLDFQNVSDIECTLISEHSKIQYCKSGIIAWEDRTVYLLNKK